MKSDTVGIMSAADCHQHGMEAYTMLNAATIGRGSRPKIYGKDCG